MSQGWFRRNKEKKEKDTPKTSAVSSNMEEDFGVSDPYRSIRYNQNSQLENQKMALALLQATESTLREKGLEYKAENYFLALWPLINNEEKEELGGMGKGKAMEFSSTVMYLISFIAPKLEVSFIKENYSGIYSKLPSAILRFMANAPFVRAALPLLKSILSAFDEADWAEKTSLVELFGIMLHLSLDPRPKVRKLAQDLLSQLIREATFSVTHPARSSLFEFLGKSLSRSTKKDCNDALHTLTLMNQLYSSLQQSEFDQILPSLIHCISLGGSNYLTSSTLSLLSRIASSIIDGVSSLSSEVQGKSNAAQIITALKSKSPAIATDTESLPDWLFCLVKWTRVKALVTVETAEVEYLFASFFEYLQCTDEKILKVIEDCMRISYCLVKEGMELAGKICQQFILYLEKKNSPLAPYIVRSSADFLREAALDNMWKCVQDLIVSLATQHDSKQTKHAALIEQTIGVALEVCGMENILSAVPLNLSGKGTPRAWLLPLIKDHVSHNNVDYFCKNLLPVADQLEQKAQEYRKGGKVNDCKVYELICTQVWATLSAFFTFPKDFTSAFPSLAPILGHRLTNYPHLRPSICNALTGMINRSLSLQTDLEYSAGEEVCARANQDITCLQGFIPNFLPILFNIFGVTEAEKRSYMAECIEAFVSISPTPSVEDFLSKMCKRMEVETDSNQLCALLELVPSILKPLSGDKCSLAVTSILPLILHKDVSVQKRAYRAIGDLLSREVLCVDHAALEEKLLAAYEIKIDSAVKKYRFRVFYKAMNSISDDCLHWIPIFLPEVILGTKEVNKQARDEAFEVALSFARRMLRGGIIKAERSGGILQQDTVASLDEYLTMVIAGLAGTTPHMISATIMTLARIIFEMGSMFDQEKLSTLLGDIISLLQSSAREVVKSALGFIKVSLSVFNKKDSSGHSLWEDHLVALMDGLFKWSEEHHQNFKVKVRHLVERLVRIYGFDRILQLTPRAHQKLLQNIRKRKERLKRQKEMGKNTEANENVEEREDDRNWDALTVGALSKATAITRMSSVTGKNRSVAAASFDQALNASDSDLDDNYAGLDDDYEDEDIPQDSILRDLSNINEDDDEAIERVLSKKLQLSSLINKRSAKRKISDDVAEDESDGEDVRLDEDGRIHVKEDESEKSDEESADEEEINSGKRAKKVRFSAEPAAAPKTKKSDAKRKGDKYEPFSYLPMTRASKKNQPKGGAVRSKSQPKFYMKKR